MSVQNKIVNKVAFKIALPLSCISVIMFCAVAAVLKMSERYYNGFFIETETKLLYDKFKREMQSATELAVSLVENIYKRNDLTQEEKFAHASEEIRNMRFGSDGYFYVYQNGSGLCRIHGANKSLENTVLWDLQNPQKTQYIIRELDEAARNKTVFVEFYWSKPNAPSGEVFPKLGTGMRIPGTDMWIGTGCYIDSIESDIAAFQHQFKRVTSFIMIISFSVFSICLISLLITSIILIWRISRPLEKIAAALKDIAQGDADLTVSLEANGKDEISDIARYFNQTIKKIAISIQSINNNAVVMGEIGGELSCNMSKTASAVNEISANIESIKQQTLGQAASVTTTVDAVEKIINTIKQLNRSIEFQTESVSQSSSSVEEMAANIASITKTLQKTDDAIKTLASATDDGKDTLISSNVITQKIAEESGSLMEASGVIQHIANQTNLLAMNAAIEAAHAGEAGKGFAVVADEIRKLSEESAEQGKTITKTLKALSVEIETLSASSKIVEEKFNIIFNLAEQVKAMSNSLTEAMKEQENGSNEVLIAIKDINAVTIEVNSGSAEMLKDSEQVAGEMYKLDGLTRVIADGMNEMAAGAVQINNAIQEVNEITQKNKTSIESLSSEVQKFKI